MPLVQASRMVIWMVIWKSGGVRLGGDAKFGVCTTCPCISTAFHVQGDETRAGRATETIVTFLLESCCFYATNDWPLEGSQSTDTLAASIVRCSIHECSQTAAGCSHHCHGSLCNIPVRVVRSERVCCMMSQVLALRLHVSHAGSQCRDNDTASSARRHERTFRSHDV